MLALFSIAVGVTVSALSYAAIRYAAKSSTNGEVQILEGIEDTLKSHRERASECLRSHKRTTKRKSV